MHIQPHDGAAGINQLRFSQQNRVKTESALGRADIQGRFEVKVKADELEIERKTRARVKTDSVDLR